MNNSMKTLNISANMKGLNSFVLKNTQIKPFFINIQVTNIPEYFPGFLSTGQNLLLSSNRKDCSFMKLSDNKFSPSTKSLCSAQFCQVIPSTF